MEVSGATVEGCQEGPDVLYADPRYASGADVVSRRNFTTGAAAFAITVGLSRDAEAITPSQGSVPQGAAALGYTNKVIDLVPTVDDIAPGRTGNYALFDSMFYDPNPPDKSLYSMENGVLKIPLGKQVVTQSRNSTQGALPYLNGAIGFYMEFDVHLSDNHPDHWPAVWAMPQEHDLRQSDHYAGDPAHYERWMELDVDEGGFGPGTLSSVIDWQGVYDPRNHQYWRDYPADTVRGDVVTNLIAKGYLDRTQRHTFGASYEPGTGLIRWYLDDHLIFNASAPAIAAQQHFYMIAGAQTHGGNVPYNIYLNRIRAYAP
jgi:hypothetical protein